MKLTENYKELTKFATGCKHKSLIRNSYGEEVYVPCGKCHYCRLNKSQRMSLLMSLEETTSKYCYFFTLTLSLDNQPYVDFKHHYSDYYKPVTDDFRLERRIDKFITRTNPSYSIHTSEEDLNSLLHRIYDYQINHGKKFRSSFPVLSKDLLINFIKRVRNECKKITDSPIRYFAVGEYGPKGLKPHYHGCFYFDDPKIQENITRIVSEKWSYGNADCSKSRSQTSSYVASYVNSFVDCPSLYQTIGVAPFSLHSQNFGLNYFKNYSKEIYENGFSFLEQASYEVLAKQCKFIPPANVLNYFYPRCKGFNHTNRYAKSFIYNFKKIIDNVYPLQTINNSSRAYMLAYTYFEFKVGNISITADKTIPYILELLQLLNINYERLSSDESLYKYYNDKYTMSDSEDSSDVNFMLLKNHIDNSYLNQLIYSVLNDSDKFYRFIDEYNSYNGVKHNSTLNYIQVIEKFYDDYAQYKLKYFYSNLEQYTQLCETEEEFDDTYMFYDNSIDLGLIVPQSNIFCTLSDISVQTRWDNSVKHKKHNDLNHILEETYTNLNDDLPF